ncbi:hypothetical protein GCM10010358_78990 [Streptomyces minutiscleroticus]|uniref:Uncharacterized protein n=1 Tax=Streptomyces minutiscleroticus TaxID=68238 RepID=A0A918P330_9ACTN|nr:hypothetical protein GCM10010358_78990 [Streptomyces minutiscleroticus]
MRDGVEDRHVGAVEQQLAGERRAVERPVVEDGHRATAARPPAGRGRGAASPAAGRVAGPAAGGVAGPAAGGVRGTPTGPASVPGATALSRPSARLFKVVSFPSGPYGDGSAGRRPDSSAVPTVPAALVVPDVLVVLVRHVRRARTSVVLDVRRENHPRRGRGQDVSVVRGAVGVVPKTSARPLSRLSALQARRERPGRS